MFEKVKCDDGGKTAPLFKDLINSPVNKGERALDGILPSSFVIRTVW